MVVLSTYETHTWYVQRFEENTKTPFRVILVGELFVRIFDFFFAQCFNLPDFFFPNFWNVNEIDICVSRKFHE